MPSRRSGAFLVLPDPLCRSCARGVTRNDTRVSIGGSDEANGPNRACSISWHQGADPDRVGRTRSSTTASHNGLAGLRPRAAPHAVGAFTCSGCFVQKMHAATEGPSGARIQIPTSSICGKSREGRATTEESLGPDHHCSIRAAWPWLILQTGARHIADCDSDMLTTLIADLRSGLVRCHREKNFLS
jgi:hypothetical protein